MADDYSCNPMTQEWNDFLTLERTMPNLVLRHVNTWKDKVALKQRVDGAWVTVTWKQMEQMVRGIGSAFIAMGIEKGDMIGIFSQNRYEWHLADMGICSTRAASVPIYATNSAPEAEYIVSDAELKAIFVGNQDQYDRVQTFKNKSTLKKIIAFDRKIMIHGDDSIYLDDFISLGHASGKDQEWQTRLEQGRPDDIFTLIYTSGTTGNPKGAIHTNESFLAGICAAQLRFEDARTDWVSLSFLPLSHVFERMWSYGILTKGLENHYCADPKQVMEVMADSKPHYMTGVPRLWEKVYATIYDRLNTAPSIKRNLFNWTVNVAGKYYDNRVSGTTNGVFLTLKRKLADILVLAKIREVLVGGRAVTFHIGGAACSPELKHFFNSIGIPLCEGFGLTEFFPACVGRPEISRDDLCGPVIAMVELKTSADGELLLKGPMAMKGYYKKPESTKDTFTSDGWFKTGDVASIIRDGKFVYIRITDRIKDIIITAGGKNIAPQQIEGLFGSDLFIEQIAIIGEKRRYITALIVPSFEMLETWAAENDIAFTDRTELVSNPKVVSLYEKRIEEATAGLGQVEKIKKFTLLPAEFSQENGEITPTFKVKRKVIDQRYREIIDKMYRE